MSRFRRRPLRPDAGQSRGRGPLRAGLAAVAVATLALGAGSPADAFEISARYARGGIYRYTEAATEEPPAGDFSALHAVRAGLLWKEDRPLRPWAAIGLRRFTARLSQTPDRLPADLETRAVALAGGLRWTPDALRVGRAAVFAEFGPSLVWARDVARTVSLTDNPEAVFGWYLGLEIAGGVGMEWRPGLRTEIGVGWSRTGRQTTHLLDLGDRQGPSEYEAFLGMTFRRSGQG